MPEFIAHYRVGAKLGQGAMGEVYRATDTKLGRDVAIKLISPTLADDESRLASFTREAQVLASLNHPNIASIYGVEDHALVMELVEGPTLADRIKQGPMSLDEALPLARQIAEGLAAAHDRGIVHRDLKPANIKITPGGVVKLLDFGLAKAAAAAAASPDDAATVAFSIVGADQIVGTPAYMAPEQARGLPLDRRADIWAFGVIVYEMLAGTPLFKGATLTDIMAAVVREEPDLTKIPVAVRPVLRRCLEKDPKRRLRDVGDAVLLLESAGASPVVEVRASARRAWLPWAAAAAAALAFAVLLAVHLRETAPPARAVRFNVTLPPEITVTQTTPFAVSPDGSAMAFPAIGADGVSRIWIQEFDKAEPRSTGTPIAAIPEVLTWLDTRSLLFSHERKLKRVDVNGGPPTTLADYEPPVLGVAVNGDGTIIYGSVAGVMRLDPSARQATRITHASGEMIRHAANDFLPDGRHFLFSASGEPGKRGVYVGSLDASPDEQPTTPILMTDFGVAFVADPRSSKRGYLLTVNGNTIVAYPFDLGSLNTTGEPASIAENVFVVNSGLGFGIAFLSTSPGGTLVYRTGTLAERLSRQLAWIGRDGKPLETLAELGRFNHVKLSPDGKRVATSRTQLETGSFADIWITNLEDETSTKFTFGGGANVQPVWSPDGRHVAWARARQKDIVLYRKPADGAGAEEELFTLPERKNLIMSDWTSDGAFIIYTYDGDVFALPVAGQAARKPIPLVKTVANEFGGVVSPDRRWIAYVSNETTQQEVYVQPFAPGNSGAPAGRWLVSQNGTMGLVRWRADSGELVFLNSDGDLVSVDVTSTPVFKPAAPRSLFRMPRAFLVQAGTPGALADTTRDLQRLLVAVPSESGRQQQLSVLLNWPAAVPGSR